ncbi:MAG: SBBP repeat-containing protein [Nitrospirota bacterium]|nr:SBBP repeat-containing protein [Nitrospirota bacterium]
MGRIFMKKRVSLISLTGFLFLVMLFPTVASADVDRGAVMKKVSGLQMPFIENQGQVKDASVRFYANTFAGTVYVTDKGEIVYSLVKTEPAAENTKDRDINPALRPKSSISKALALRESLTGLKKTGKKGESISLHPVGINKSVTRVNYFIGKKENWRTGIPTWQEVNLGEVYKGIELKLKAYGKNVEKLFTVQPVGSVEKIRLKIEGAKRLRVNSEGELEIETAFGTVKMTRPVAYQEIDGKRVEIAANYIVSSQSQGLTYGFQVGEYDKTKPLIIDPLLASTFLGGSSSDNAISIIVDNSGNIYVSGGTYSSDFPTTTGAFDTIFSYVEAFVSKFDGDLEELLASTFIGPAFYSNSMAIDRNGNIYVAGVTPSPDFPTTPGAYDRTIGLGDPQPWDSSFFDGFISKFDGDLENLLASTFLGLLTDYDFSGPIEITLDNDGNIYMASPFRCGYVYNEIYCAFIAKFDARLENQLASILLSRGSSANAISVDSSGNVYVVGSGNITTPGAYDETYNGGGDVFVSKFDGNLEGILAATFLGGEAGESSDSVFTDDSGNIYVTGLTWSPDFPVTPGAYDETYNGGGDIFVSKFDNDLENLLASTFLGGDDNDKASFVMVGSSGDLYVTGWTVSANFPTTPDAYDTTYNGDSDAFISKFDSNLETLLSSTYLGGIDRDNANSLTIDGNGDVFVTGRTKSSDFPTTAGAYDTFLDVGYYFHAFVSKFTFGKESTHPHKRKCRH